MSDPSIEIPEVDEDWVDMTNPSAVVQALEYPLSHKVGPSHAPTEEPIESLTYRRMNAADYEKLAKAGKTPGAVMQTICDLTQIQNVQLVKKLDINDYARAEAVVLHFLQPFLSKQK